jgi:manganese transport protein
VVTVPSETAPLLRRIGHRVSLLGPAFVAAVAYVDPGNVVTNVSAGARYGYLLVWVLIVANLMAGLVQYLSAKLGLVTGYSLPEAVAAMLRAGSDDPRPERRKARLAFWAQAEIVAMATDIAEVLGGAVALEILFGLPLVLGGLITGAVSSVLLLVQDRGGQRRFERVVVGMLAVVAIGFGAGLLVAPPGTAAISGLVPRFHGVDSVLLAAGMLGATVMPHAVYLHSAATRDRHGWTRLRWASLVPTLLKTTRLDVILAMVLAGAVNLAMLLVSASALPGRPDVDTLEGAHAGFVDVLGPLIGALFAIGLLASGFASTAVGCYAGAVVMEGLLRRKVPLLVRRLVTLIPGLLVLGLTTDPTAALLLSQVILSFGIPFALIPLVMITSRRTVMGAHVNRRTTTAVAVAVAIAIIALNLALIVLTLTR